jgi:hypothetical protein
MESMRSPTAFSDEAVGAIIQALPANVIPERRKLLPRLLRDWVDHELPYRLYRENPANVRERQSRLQAVASRAEDLCEALAALDRQATFWLAMQSATHETGKSFVRLNQSDVTQARERLQSVENWARKLAEASRDLSESQAKGRGRPRAIIPYLVMFDLEAIFEFVTGTRAERRVRGEDHHEHGKEYGPFWDFVQPIWGMIFGSHAGLSAAMKNWSSARNKFGDTSAILANIAFRHPEWRISG